MRRSIIGQFHFVPIAAVRLRLIGQPLPQLRSKNFAVPWSLFRARVWALNYIIDSTTCHGYGKLIDSIEYEVRIEAAGEQQKLSNKT